jgi:predicted membrane chloride channel (bestrophin family)
MILYDEGRWGLCFVWKAAGSVLPKAMVLSIPSAICAFAVNVVYTKAQASDMYKPDTEGLTTVLSGYSVGLAFLLIFRTQIAYARLWEGLGHLQVIRSAWLNVVGCCFAFCTNDPEKAADVDHFQNYLIRMMSMLYSLSLQSCNKSETRTLPVINLTGLDKFALGWLMEQENKTDVMTQWIQRLIVEASRTETIDVQAPILSRVFQGLETGLRELAFAHRINEMAFPFPYAQLMSVLLQFHTPFTILVAGLSVSNPVGSAVMAFMVVLTYWSLNYVAMEIEMPYGDDSNDLRLVLMQEQMNTVLKVYLEPYSLKAPHFEFKSSLGHVPKPKPTEQNLRIRSSEVLKEPVLDFVLTSPIMDVNEESKTSIQNKREPFLAEEKLEERSVTVQPLQDQILFDPGSSNDKESSDLRFPDNLGSATMPVQSIPPTIAKKKGKKLPTGFMKKDARLESKLESVDKALTRQCSAAINPRRGNVNHAKTVGGDQVLARLKEAEEDDNVA